MADWGSDDTVDTDCYTPDVGAEEGNGDTPAAADVDHTPGWGIDDDKVDTYAVGTAVPLL